MAEIFTLQKPSRNQNRQPLPTDYDNDQYTPRPYENFNEPIKDDQPFKPYSPPIKSSHSKSDGRTELYHFKNGENKSKPIPDDQAIPPDRRSPSGFNSNKRVSPMPYQNSNPTPSEQGSEMYYIQLGDEPRRPSASMKKTTFNDQPTYHEIPYEDPDPDYQPRKVTVYMLADPAVENIPPPYNAEPRTPSPQIHTTKKQQAVSYTILDDDNKKHDVPTKRRPFPTALNDVSTNIRYVPLTQSKASESIQRSMNKYRFGGN